MKKTPSFVIPSQGTSRRGPVVPDLIEDSLGVALFDQDDPAIRIGVIREAVRLVLHDESLDEVSDDGVGGVIG